ncbi:MAG: DUF63 family protein [Candidatus Aenigmatarchaeota archaeon]|nr:DUF63 family protein [Candidatus Aenigmarchaeota archaeon]
MDINSYIYEKFINPLCHYYTLEATLLYGLILCIFALGIYKVINKLKIKIDKYFFIGFIPFIIYGGWTRALKDHGAGIYSNNAWWWCSPPIYFIIFILVFITFLISILTEKKFKIKYYKILFGTGLIFCFYNLSITKITNPLSLYYVFLFSMFCLIFILFLLKLNLLSKINASIIFAHLFDASSTYTALTYFGYYEQHVLPSFLISNFGAWIMFPLKLIVVWLSLLLIDKYADNQNFKNFLKFIILILGLALGIRDCLTVSMVEL